MAKKTQVTCARGQEKACGALWNLANNDANKMKLVRAEVHMHIIRAMDWHQDDAKVQEKACSALWNLVANDANKVTLVAAEAHLRIIRAMDRHQDDAKVQRGLRHSRSASSSRCRNSA
jgi:hypothetical protein